MYESLMNKFQHFLLDVLNMEVLFALLSQGAQTLLCCASYKSINTSVGPNRAVMAGSKSQVNTF